MRPNGYIIQMGYRLLLWYIKKCIFTTVIGGIIYQYLHSLKEKCNMKTIRKKIQKCTSGKTGVVLYPGQYSNVLTITNVKLWNEICQKLLLHSPFLLTVMQTPSNGPREVEIACGPHHCRPERLHRDNLDIITREREETPSYSIA